jgi:hypothetical protein
VFEENCTVNPISCTGFNTLLKLTDITLNSLHSCLFGHARNSSVPQPEGCVNIIFQQEGAIPHFCNTVQQKSNDQFPYQEMDKTKIKQKKEEEED